MLLRNEKCVFGINFAAILISIVLSEAGLHIASGILMCLAAAGLYMLFYRHSRNLVNLVGLLSLFWIGGAGVACFKLSYLSADSWAAVTWISIIGFYLCFVAGYFLVSHYAKGTAEEREGEAIQTKQTVLRRLFVSIIVMTVVPLLAFILEACLLGFIPALIQDTPHAYSYFHISGVHYFTVSSCFVHPLSILYLYWNRGENRRDKRVRIIVPMNVIAIAIPILCVSRYFLIMAVALSLVVFLSLKKNMRAKTLLILLGACLLILAPAYVLLTVFRGHSISYLNEIFEMKNADMPIFITQPYMYVANNYENLNCLVTQLPQFTYGRRILFPLMALTGMKFLFPSFVPAVLYVTKTELTTLTLVYDAYYDFGVAGVLLFGLLLGGAGCLITRKTLQNHNPIAYLFYAQIAMYMVLSFFTTWFSNPTTWFWLVLTGIAYVYVGGSRFRRKQTG